MRDCALAVEPRESVDAPTDTSDTQAASANPLKYGGIDPEDETNFDRVGFIPDDDLITGGRSSVQLDTKVLKPSSAAVFDSGTSSSSRVG
jgi:hypothetical protein